MENKKLKSTLNKQSKEELVDIIDDLYKKYKPVKDYFDFKKYIDKENLLKEYKAKINEGFYPPKGWAVKLSKPLREIKEFKSHEPDAEPIIELMLYYVESGIAFSNKFGNMVENLFESMEEVYSEALNLLQENQLLDKYNKRCLKIVNASKNTGWGFYGVLKEIYFDYFKEKLKKAV